MYLQFVFGLLNPRKKLSHSRAALKMFDTPGQGSMSMSNNEQSSVSEGSPERDDAVINDTVTFVADLKQF